MNRSPSHPIRVVTICIFFALLLWFIIKNQLEPNFWAKAWLSYQLNIRHAIGG